jgi:hypothetical protein
MVTPYIYLLKIKTQIKSVHAGDRIATRVNSLFQDIGIGYFGVISAVVGECIYILQIRRQFQVIDFYSTKWSQASFKFIVPLVFGRGILVSEFTTNF